MASLIALPAELKELIVYQTSPRDKLSLVKTCKALRDVTLPALYRTVTVTWGAEESHRLQILRNGLIPLTRTLIETPSLAAHVRKAELKSRDPRYECVAQARSSPEDPMPSHSNLLFSKAFSTSGISPQDFTSSLTALFLVQCPNMEDLVLHGSNFFSKIEFDISKKKGPLLENLTTLRLLQYQGEPKLQQLLIHVAPNVKVLEYDVLLPSSKAPLDCTELRSALHLVQHSLTELVISYDVFSDEAVDVMTLAVVCAGSLGSLRDFSSLNSLRVSLALLFGQEKRDDDPTLAGVLPRNLRRLTICDDLWGFDALVPLSWEQIMAVLRRFFAGEKMVDDGEEIEQEEDYAYRWVKVGEPEWKSATPGLEEFVLDMRERGEYFEDDWDENQNEELKRLCEAQGIKCDILPPRDPWWA